MRKLLLISTTFILLPLFWNITNADCASWAFCWAKQICNSDYCCTDYKTFEDNCWDTEWYNFQYPWECQECVHLWWGLVYWTLEWTEPQSCCEWLTPVSPKMLNDWPPMADLPAICIKKWDWICDTRYEDEKNSPEDCSEKKCSDEVQVCNDGSVITQKWENCEFEACPWSEDESIMFCERFDDPVCASIIKCTEQWSHTCEKTYETFENECYLSTREHSYKYQYEYKWECEVLPLEIRNKIENLVNNFMNKVDLKYTDKEKRVSFLDLMISKFEKIEPKNEKLEAVVTSIVYKLKKLKRAIKNDIESSECYSKWWEWDYKTGFPYRDNIHDKANWECKY